jgi:hypothetical protein
MMCGEERLDLYRVVTRTPPEYAAVRIDPDADSDSDPERDESGEDYLYGADRFLLVDLPAGTVRVLNRSFARHAEEAR